MGRLERFDSLDEFLDAHGHVHCAKSGVKGVSNKTRNIMYSTREAGLLGQTTIEQSIAETLPTITFMQSRISHVSA
jgi:hypothetical protein